MLISCLALTGKSQNRNLAFYLQEALHNSPLLNDYRNQAGAASSDSLLIRAARMPQVDAKTQLQYSPFYDNFGYEEVITNGGNYMALMGVSQKILNRKELSSRYLSVELRKKAIDNSSRLSTYELNKLITDQYLAAYSVLSDLLFNRSFLKLSMEENEIVSQFVKNGIYRQTDYLSLQVEIQSQEILISQLEGRYRKEQSFLNRLCGLKDTIYYKLEEPNLQIIGVPDILKSPVLIQYKIDSLRIENEKTSIDVRYKPKVNWFADAGFLTSNPWNFYQHFGYSAGISLNIPVYDGRQKIIEKQKLALDENSRSTYEETYRNQYYQQIRQLYEELRALNETHDRTVKQIATSELLVKELKRQLETGNIQMTDYINAIRSYRTINRNLIILNIQKLQITNEMNFFMTR